MARINIEDKLWSDPRFLNLIGAIGVKLAIGELVILWRTGQEFWKDGAQVIPESRYLKCKFSAELEDFGFVKRIDSGFYVCGSGEQFAWIESKRKNGKKGGEANAKRIEASASVSLSDGKANQSESNPLTLPLSLSLKEEEKTYIPSECVAQPPQAVVCSPAQETELKLVSQEIALIGTSLEKKSKFTEANRMKMRAFIGAYAEGYKAKYNAQPEGLRDKAIIGKIGHWLDGVSEARAVSLVQAYLQITYKPFTENFHDLWQFFRHLNRIGHALDNGRDASTINWGEVFRGAS